MDQIQFKLKTESNGKLETIKPGSLENIDGNLFEYKHFWDGATAYKNPTVVFLFENKTESLSLHLTEKGYSGTKTVKGIKFGCNLNRVKNRKNRWGVTIWMELNASQVAS